MAKPSGRPISRHMRIVINLKRDSFSIRLTVIRQSFRSRICGANVSSPSANSHNSFWAKRLPKKVFIVACPERANWTAAKIAANFQLHIGFFTSILLLGLSFFCFLHRQPKPSHAFNWMLNATGNGVSTYDGLPAASPRVGYNGNGNGPMRIAGESFFSLHIASGAVGGGGQG